MSADPLLEKVLARLLPPSYAAALAGDLAEEYEIRREEVGRTAALRWYRREAAAAIVHALAARAVNVLTGRNDMQIRSKPAVVRNLAAFALGWLAGFALVQAVYWTIGAWQLTALAQLAGFAAGTWIAIRFDARVTAYLFAAMTAFSLAELAIQLPLGNRVVQGGPTHLAVMAAAVLGIAFGVLMVRYLDRKPAAAVTT